MFITQVNSINVIGSLLNLFPDCRLQQDHKCPEFTAPQHSMTATKAVVKEILANSSEQKTSKKLRSVKAQKTAAKVQLMKLKMKSMGDKSLPQEERVYLLVC